MPIVGDKNQHWLPNPYPLGCPKVANGYLALAVWRPKHQCSGHKPQVATQPCLAKGPKVGKGYTTPTVSGVPNAQLLHQTNINSPPICTAVDRWVKVVFQCVELAFSSTI